MKTIVLKFDLGLNEVIRVFTKMIVVLNINDLSIIMSVYVISLILSILFICSFDVSISFKTINLLRNRHQTCLSPLTSLSSSQSSTPSPSVSKAVGQSIGYYEELSVKSNKGIHFTDITAEVRRIVKESGVKEGVVTVLSRHTTTAITINEMESRLVDDARQFLLKLVPSAYPYLHNDLHLRAGPPGWPGGDEAWRAQEPINCHSHLIAMLLGSSEAIPVSRGEIKIGTWQSIIVAELDGPRTRSIAVQVTGVL